MFNYELLPKLASNQKYQDIKEQQEENNSKIDANCVSLFKLPPLIQNSALIRQRLKSGAKDTLAAASLNAGASVPLAANCSPASVTSRGLLTTIPNEGNPKVGPPRNRVNPSMVSVVRPVLSSHAQEHQFEQPREREALEMKADFFSNQEMLLAPNKADLVEELMGQEERCLKSANCELERLNLELFNLNSSDYPRRRNSLEMDERQQMALLRREQVQLNSRVRKQHEFVLAKLEQRKRGLRIVQAVWVQQDFKRAMERLVDLYNEGLSFKLDSLPTTRGADEFVKMPSNIYNFHEHNHKQQQLSSLNNTLVADVLGVIVLRPKLWSLDTCQLLLPIITSDFLSPADANCSAQAKSYRDDQAELAMKALKLILTHFSSLILSTLQQHQQLGSKTGGVDLNREERFNRCLSCFKLLQEAQAQLARWRPLSGSPTSNRLLGLSRELEQLFHSALQTNIGGSFPSTTAATATTKSQHLSQNQTSCQKRGH